MTPLFVKNLERMKSEIIALKTDRLKSATTISTQSWTGTVNITVQNWAPTKTARITITPTSTTSPNLLSSLTFQGSWNQSYFRVLRRASGNQTIYYLTYLDDVDSTQNKTISMPIEVRLTAPASVALDYVEPIYGN